jgi:hypothetical protein
VRDRATLRPSRHADRPVAWIETLFGHIKAEFPHLDKIADAAVLRAELEARERRIAYHRQQRNQRTPDTR